MSPENHPIVVYINNITLTSRAVTMTGTTPEDQALQWLVNFGSLGRMPNTTINQNRLRQRYALMVFGFQPTTTKTNLATYNDWLLPANVANECTWTHITCSGSTVTGFTPPFYSFSFAPAARMSAEIGLLSWLNTVDFDGKSLRGSLPDTLGRLTQMWRFAVNYNNMTGTVPAGVYTWTNIKYLYFMGNSFTGTIGPFANGFCPVTTSRDRTDVSLMADCCPLANGTVEIYCACCSHCFSDNGCTKGTRTIAPTKEPTKAPMRAPTAPSPYTIQLDFTNISSASDRIVFEGAARRWEEVIRGDLPNIPQASLPARTDNCTWPSQIDDLYICAKFAAIDGPNGVLGYAGPDYIRPDSGLAGSGNMVFDQDDIVNLQKNGGSAFVNTILHEMGHVIGIGNLWDDKNVTKAAPNCDYVGPNAIREYKAISGCPFAVPIERDGGAACGHWDDECLRNELMTGYFSAGTNPLSRITVGSLQDLGYQVDYSNADAFGRSDLNPLCLCGVRKKARSLSDMAHGQVVPLGQKSSPRHPRRRLSAAAQALAIEAGLEFLASNAKAHAEAETKRPNHKHTGVRYVGDKFVSVMFAEHGEIFGVSVRSEK